jgi:acylphosphatase
MSDTAAFFALVQGYVQGVGFRYSALREARGLGLRGYVRNEADGSVAVYAEGDREALASFREWLEQGPCGARVDGVQAHSRSPCGYYESFSIES